MSAEEKTALTMASAQARTRRAEERTAAVEEARKGTRVLLAEAVEELGANLVAAYRAALASGSPVDLRRAQAAEYLLSRVYGKPAQPTRDDTPSVVGTLAELEAMSLEDLARLARSEGLVPTHDHDPTQAL